MKKIIYVLTLFVFSACFSLKPDPTVDELVKARQFVEMGTMQLLQGQLDEAEATFELANEIAELPETVDGLGCVAFMRQDFKEAHRLYWKAHELDPDYAEAIEHLALMYDVLGFDDEADIMYKRALAMDPTLFQGHNNRAVFMAEKNKGFHKEIQNSFLKSQALLDNVIVRENIEKFKREF